MVESKVIVVSSMLSKEIPNVLGEIQHHISSSLLKTSEGELRNIAVKPLTELLKATIGGVPFGIISITKGWVTKIEVWISTGELRESWATAIKLAAQQIFSDPAVGKIDWRITKSNTDMIVIAEGCRFIKEGELIGEGLNREPLVLMGLLRQKGTQTQEAVLRTSAASPADIVEKDKAIEELESKVIGLEAKNETMQKEIVAKNELIKNLQPKIAALEEALKEESAKVIHAQKELHILTEKGSGEETDEVSVLKQKIIDLESVNIQLENKIKEQAKLLKQKSDQIIDQAKTIQELQKAVDPATPKEELEKTQDYKDKSIENNPADDETEIETAPPKMAIEELEKLISKILYPVPREMLKWIILQPGIGYPELAKKADTSANYVSMKAGQFAELGLIVRRHKNPANHRLVSLYPAKGVIQKLQEMAQNRKNLSGLPIKQSWNESRQKNELGLNIFDITVLKLIIQEPDRGLKQQEMIAKIHEQQPGKTRESVQCRVNTSVKKLANLKLATNESVGAENQSKPIMENIRQLPEELQKELGIQKTDEEIKIPVVEPAELVAEIEETVEKTDGLKPLPEKIEVISEAQPGAGTDEAEISQRAERALEIISSNTSLTKGISLKELCKEIGIDPRSEDGTQLLQLIEDKCHIMGDPKTPKKCFLKKKIVLPKAEGNNGDRKTIADIVKENGFSEIHAQILVKLKNAGSSLLRIDLNGNDPELTALAEKQIITIEEEVVKLLVPL